MSAAEITAGAMSRAEGTEWGAVLCMSLLTFVLVGSEFMPVSLLTPIAREFAVTEGQAGQSIAISGLFAIITSLFGNALL
jgi:predicted MFS family arabinose efflux permease